MENRNWTVYIHIVPSKIPKYYVGITSQTTYGRWQKDGRGYKNQKLFYRAIRKYGWDNIEHFIIANNLTEKEAKKFEQTLISKLDSTNPKHGYNITHGGDGHLGQISPKRKDLTGERYGKLTALRLADKTTRNKQLFWECQCDCGNKSIVSVGNWGNIKSCGCEKYSGFKNRRSDTRLPIGYKTEMLTVLDYDLTGNDIKYICSCECGNIKSIVGYNLKNGHTKSCGCLKNRKRTIETE